MSTTYRFDYDEIKSRFDTAANQITSYRRNSSDQMLFKPSPGTWSARDVCQHLVVFGRIYLREIDSAISKTKPIPQREGYYRPRWHFRKLAAFFEPPYKLKMKTVSAFSPGDEKSVVQALNDLEDVQQKILNILKQAESASWDLQKIKGKHPLISFLSVSLIEYLVLTEVHQRRHFWQIQMIFELYEKKKI